MGQLKIAPRVGLMAKRTIQPKGKTTESLKQNYIEQTHQEAVANLWSYLNSHANLAGRFYTLIKPMLDVSVLNKTEVIVNKGGICTTAFWMELGYSRCFTKMEDGEGILREVTIDFCRFNKILIIPECFFNGLPCRYNMEIARGSVTVPFSKACFDVFKLNTPEVEALANKILSLERSESLEKSNMLRMKPRARYHEFLRIFGAEIEQFFAVKHIASYLGMQPSYLSRLRSENAKKA